MLKSQWKAGSHALSLTLLIVFSAVAVRTERAAAEPPGRPDVAPATSPEPNRTATFHTFDIEEVFTSRDGLVQFIELRESDGVDGNLHFAGNLLTTNGNVFAYPTDLPDTITANRFVLIATASFATLPGAVTPDYIIPQQFFEITGDTISIVEIATDITVDTFDLALASGFPSDGVLSLNRDGTTGVNSPTNFAGESGSVNAAPSIPALSRASLVVMTLVLVCAGVVIMRVRRRCLARC